MDFYFVSFHSSAIVKPTRSSLLKIKSLCNLLHGPSKMVLARTDALNERNFGTDTQLGLTSARP